VLAKTNFHYWLFGCQNAVLANAFVCPNAMLATNNNNARHLTGVTAL